MRCKVLRGFCRGAGVNVEPGDIIEVEPNDAREWLHLGYIERAPEEEPAPAAGDEEAKHPEQKPETVATQKVTPTAREPKGR